MIYQIKQSSVFLHFVAFMAVMCIAAIAFVPVLKHFLHQPFPYIFFLYAILAAILYPLITYVPRYLSSVTVELYLTKEGVEQRWLRRFPFQKKQDAIIAWSEIDEYVFQPDRHFDHFKIYLRNNTFLHLVHNQEHDKDDFKLFVKDFLQRVQNINAAQETTVIKKGRKDHVQEIRVLTGTLIFIALFAPYMLLIFKPRVPIPTPTYIMMWLGYFVVLLVLLRSIQRLKRDT